MNFLLLLLCTHIMYAAEAPPSYEAIMGDETATLHVSSAPLQSPTLPVHMSVGTGRHINTASFQPFGWTIEGRSVGSVLEECFRAGAPSQTTPVSLAQPLLQKLLEDAANMLTCNDSRVTFQRGGYAWLSWNKNPLQAHELRRLNTNTLVWTPVAPTEAIRNGMVRIDFHQGKSLLGCRNVSSLTPQASPPAPQQRAQPQAQTSAPPVASPPVQELQPTLPTRLPLHCGRSFDTLATLVPLRKITKKDLPKSMCAAIVKHPYTHEPNINLMGDKPLEAFGIITKAVVTYETMMGKAYQGDFLDGFVWVALAKVQPLSIYATHQLDLGLRNGTWGRAVVPDDPCITKDELRVMIAHADVIFSTSSLTRHGLEYPHQQFSTNDVMLASHHTGKTLLRVETTHIKRKPLTQIAEGRWRFLRYIMREDTPLSVILALPRRT